MTRLDLVDVGGVVAVEFGPVTAGRVGGSARERSWPESRRGRWWSRTVRATSGGGGAALVVRVANIFVPPRSRAGSTLRYSSACASMDSSAPTGPRQTATPYRPQIHGFRDPTPANP